MIACGSSVLICAVEIFRPESEDSYYLKVKGRMKPPKTPPESKKKGATEALNMFIGIFWREPKRRAAYYRAYSYVRLHSPAAITEIDRQTADYKLFRSLVLVFFLDFPLAWTNGSLDRPRAAVMSLLFALALWRFLSLLNWARRLTFEYCDLILEEKAAADKAPNSAAVGASQLS
jgi:hypothetical protein